MNGYFCLYPLIVFLFLISGSLHAKGNLKQIIANENWSCPDGAKLKVLNREVISYDKNGAGNFLNGKMKACIQKYRGQEHFNGKAIIWFPNGQKASEATYNLKGLDGVATEWNIRGFKITESSFKDGVQDGPSTRWQENGDFKTTNYKGGRPHGREFGKIKGITFEHEYQYGLKVK